MSKEAKDRVTRIKESDYKRIQNFFDDKKKRTIKESLGEILDIVEMMRDGKPMYCNELFEDVADARGQAIVQAVREKRAPRMPKVVLVIGEDRPNEGENSAN